MFFNLAKASAFLRSFLMLYRHSKHLIWFLDVLRFDNTKFSHSKLKVVHRQFSVLVRNVTPPNIYFSDFVILMIILCFEMVI